MQSPTCRATSLIQHFGTMTSCSSVRVYAATTWQLVTSFLQISYLESGHFPRIHQSGIKPKTPTNQQLPQIFKCSQQKPMSEHWIRQQVSGHLSNSWSSFVKPALHWESMKGSSSRETCNCQNNITLWRNGKIILTSLFYPILDDMASSFRYIAEGSPLE